MKILQKSTSKTGFQLLTGEAQSALSKCEHSVICCMILIAAFSILWSFSIHLLSRDFPHEFIGAKFRFRDRDFSQLSDKSKEILKRDLEKVLNEAYLDSENTHIKNNAIAKEYEPVNEKNTTMKPKTRKIAHVFQSGLKNESIEDEAVIEDAKPTEVPKPKVNMQQDRSFLSNKSIDVHQTVWRANTAIQFIYSFPFLSETVSIVWTAMCLIYQSSIKKQWGLPKPWRIVVPSILIFSLMSLTSAIYTILANKYLTSFCTDLRQELSDPSRLSCGQAISVLRPIVEQHKLSHDANLILFRASYIVTLVLWILALLIMLIRYKSAIDFQLVNVSITPRDTDRLPKISRKDQEFTEVLLNSPQDQVAQHMPAEAIRNRSEDDFQSARSQLSEIGAQFLEGQRKYTALPA